MTIVAGDAANGRGPNSSRELSARCVDARRVNRRIFSALLLTCGSVALYDLYLLAASLVGA